MESWASLENRRRRSWKHGAQVQFTAKYYYDGDNNIKPSLQRWMKLRLAGCVAFLVNPPGITKTLIYACGSCMWTHERQTVLAVSLLALSLP